MTIRAGEQVKYLGDSDGSFKMVHNGANNQYEVTYKPNGQIDKVDIVKGEWQAAQATKIGGVLVEEGATVQKILSVPVGI